MLSQRISKINSRMNYKFACYLGYCPTLMERENSEIKRLADRLKAVTNKETLANILEWQDRNLIHRSHFLIDTINKKIIGYISLHLTRIKIKVAHEEIFCPILWVSNFGIDIKYKDTEAQVILLDYIHELAELISINVGCRFIMLEIQKNLQKEYIDPMLKVFFEDNGFRRFPFEIKRERIGRGSL